MKYGLVLLLWVVVPCWAQTTTTGKAETAGPCSPAVTGNSNQFTINCPGVSKAQGQKMLDILNKILVNQLDPNKVMSKLDEILKAVNPNRPAKTYFCNGQWRTEGPGAHAALEVVMGGDDVAFQKMVGLNNDKKFGDLLTECLSQIRAAPEWLTPRLFCGLAYLATGDRAKAEAMLNEFDSKTGPAYDVEACNQMSAFLRQKLPK
jgi:hypothetical protein